MHQHEKYIRHCIDSAASALRDVAPNPMVGACVVIDDEIVASGIHERYGEAHAEVNAIANAAGADLQRATLYVTLEPCSHHGKTPPCVDAIIAANIPRVVAATRDPNPRVAGSGFAALKNQGIEVVEDILAAEARFLNKRFFTFHKKGRPYVILKWAHTSDGFIARKDYTSKWISSPESRALVHRWRGEEQAILIGTRTALHDDPELTARDAQGKNPLRLVIDANGTLPAARKLWQPTARTVRFTGAASGPHDSEEVFILDRNYDLFPQILAMLHERSILSVIVEGGAETLRRILADGLWDEARIFECPSRFEEGIPAPHLESFASAHPLLAERRQLIAGDSLRILYNPEVSTIL